MANSKELDELLKTMNESQQELFRKLTAARTASTALRPAGKLQLSPAEQQLLKQEAESFKAKQRSAALTIGQLVTTQLDAAVRTGDVEEIRRAILGQHGAWDDCNCTSGSSLKS